MSRILTIQAIFAFVNISYSQDLDNYTIIIDKDTFSIKLSPQEIKETEIKRILKLEYASSYRTKRKRLQERIGGNIKLKGNDTIYLVGINDYFDNYFIGFLGTTKKLSKKEYELNPIGFKRLNFSDIEWLETGGKRNIWPQFILGFVTSIVGAELTVFPIVNLFFDDRNPFLVNTNWSCDILYWI